MQNLSDILDDIAIGPPVRVEIGALPGRRRSVTATAVFAALDVETETIVGRFAELGTDAGSRHADAAIVLRKLIAIENLNIGAPLAEYGSLRGWAAESPEGRRIMAGAVPVYVEQSRPTYEELETLQAAVHLLITNGEGRNPYEITTHAKDCTATIWEDQANDVLAPVKSLGRCSACVSQRGLWDTIIKRFGGSDVGRKGQYALERAAHLKQFRPTANRVSVRDWEYAQIAMAENKKREIYLDWKAGQDAKNR